MQFFANITISELSVTFAGRSVVMNRDIVESMVSMAMDAIKNAYSERYNFPVGACVLSSDGAMYSGVTIDNANPQLCCAAEALALYKAIADGKREFDAVAVIADTEKPYVPSGMSLELMSEFNVPELIMANMNGDVEETTLEEFFPSGAKLRENKRFKL